MKVAFYVPILNIGGYERVVVNYANYFANSHEVTIVCGKAEGDMKDAICKMVQIADLNARARSLVPALVRWLKNNECDILYVPFATYTAMAVIAKKIAKSKVAIYGVQHGFEENGRILTPVLSRFVKRADVLGAVSSSVAEHEAKRLKIDSKRYYIFDNPVFTPESAISSVELDWFNQKRGVILVTSGRLAEDKHIEIPIKILSELIKKGKEASLLILGDGPEREGLKALVGELGLDGFVLFAGYVNNPIAYIGQCDIYMQTSKIESFGNGIIEAQICDLPAVVTNCGGPVDLIGDKFGINIGDFDSPDVVNNGVEAVCRIIENRQAFSGMRQNAERYNVANLEEQFFAPYEQLKSQNARGE